MEILNVEKHRIVAFCQICRFIVQMEEYYCLDWASAIQGDIDFTVQAENNNKFNKAIEQDRTIMLEAGVVRVVKRRKLISFE